MTDLARLKSDRSLGNEVNSFATKKRYYFRTIFHGVVLWEILQVAGLHPHEVVYLFSNELILKIVFFK